MNEESLKEFLDNNYQLIIIIAIWEAIWKLIGMWKSGRKNQLGWFICIALINTIGILPIIYLIRQLKKNS